MPKNIISDEGGVSHEKKYYKVYIEPMSEGERFQGVLEAKDEDDAINKANDGEIIENFMYSPHQAGL